MELGGGGPPKCWNVPGAEQVEGTPVEVFPTSACSGEYVARGANNTRLLSSLLAPGAAGGVGLAPDDRSDAATPGGVVERVYAIYRVPDSDFEAPYWPAGEYAVVFVNRQADELWGTTVRIADGGIVRIDFGCGRVPPASMAVGHTEHLLQEPLGEFSLGGAALLEVVTHLPLERAGETDEPRRVVLELRESIGGYYSVLVDASTEIASADGSPATLESLEAGQLVEVLGTPLPWSLLQAEHVVIVPSPSSGLPSGSAIEIGTLREARPRGARGDERNRP